MHTCVGLGSGSELLELESTSGVKVQANTSQVHKVHTHFFVLPGEHLRVDSSADVHVHKSQRRVIMYIFNTRCDFLTEQCTVYAHTSSLPSCIFFAL